MEKENTRELKSEQKQKVDLSHHIAYSAVATLVGHPFRVCLNQASLYQSPWETLVHSRPYLFNGMLTNLLRGSLSTGLPSYTKQLVQENIGFKSSIVAAVFCGTLVAVGIETPFLRKTTLLGQTAASASLWRFSPALTSLYILREVGFSFAVLAKNDLSPAAQYGVLFGGAWVTAVAHKFAALEAIRDRLPVGETIPDFNKGVLSSIKAMAKGDVYTHPVFQVPYKNPSTFLAIMGNLLHVSCGFNMYLFRLMYLAVFREAYHTAKEAGTSINSSSFGFFSSSQQNLTRDGQREERLSVAKTP